MGDPLLVNSIKDLMVCKEESTKAQLRLFNNTKKCRTTDIKNTKNDDVIVKAENGKVLNKRLYQLNSVQYEKCQDLCDLAYFNDASILYNLRMRYLSCLIYVSNFN